MDLYLVDGNSYVYRAFYAIKGLTNSKGLPTNAAFGFTNMLLKIIREKGPEGLAVCFDSPGRTERHDLFKDYKAHRPEAPSELIAQLPYIRKIISAFHIKTFEVPGYEADDLIGTIAKKAGRDGNKVFIVTADKDMLQLVDDNIKIYDPMKEKVLDSDYVRERFGIGPERITEFMALTGDSVDNIPGIKGVGEKTAKELLLQFESIEDLLDHPERINKERLRAMVSSGREIVLLSRRLATIDTAVPIDIELSEFMLTEPDWLSLLSLFRELELSSLMKLIPAVETVRRHETIDSVVKLEEVLSLIGKEVAINTEASGKSALTSYIVGIAFCSEKDRAYYVPIARSATDAGKRLVKDEVFPRISPALENAEIAKIGHNLKYDIMLLGHEGIEVAGNFFDTVIAAY
jgi:DNA polymerase-1